jgi:ABC-type transport system involved in multi-copper enzyme maturation permease subunit
VPFACVATLGGVIREEMQHDTLVFLGTRPVTRIELLGGIYLCQTVFIQILALLHFVVFLAVGAMKSVDGLMQVAPIWFVAQFLAIWVWSALGLALGLISKRYLALAAFYAGLVEMGLYRIPTNIRSLSMRVHLESLLARSETLQTQFEYQSGSLTINLLALGAGASVALIIAGLLYNFKEYHATEEMQK